jgi:hypothetical protein
MQPEKSVKMVFTPGEVKEVRHVLEVLCKLIGPSLLQSISEEALARLLPQLGPQQSLTET